MNYAIISVSAEGARLGARVKKELKGTGTLYERKGSESGEEAKYFTRTIALTAEIFSKYDAILFIMATGIVVRAIAPHVVSKASDPAILCMDECGKHCISLLSGHLGGANAWTREVASAAGAEPVITTATDVHGRKSPDDMAREMMMRIEPLDALKPVNSVIAEGRKFLWFIDKTVQGADSIKERFRKEGITLRSSDDMEGHDFEACAIITEGNHIKSKAPYVYLRPQNLYMGIGCKRGTTENLIQDAFEGALKLADAYDYQVASLASVDVKADEKGLLDFAKHKNIPIHFYKAEELKTIADEYSLETSEFVEKKIGVGNICQSAALKEANRGKTLLPKTKFVSATAAIAVGLSVSSVSAPDIKKK